MINVLFPSTASDVAQESFDVDETSSREVDAALVKRARQAVCDGVVMLRNEGDVLPLAPHSRVAVFGRCQIDWFSVGYGSGGEVHAPYRTNLVDCLIATDAVSVDAALVDLYRQWTAEHPIDLRDWGSGLLSYPEMPLDDGVVEAAAWRNDVAIVVVGRAAGEDRDMVLGPGSYYLTDAERELITRVSDAFDRVVVVVVTGNIIDLSWADEMGISSLLMAWLGGMEGGRGMADVLIGVHEPGGRLTGTIAKSYADYPGSEQFGQADAVTYAEDIYVGYRWFDTFCANRVAFPFGFGLGYTTFCIAASMIREEGGVTVRVLVTNTGQRAGREVIQVYAGGPSTTAGRPARALVAFAKTEQLEPGSSVTVTLTFRDADLALFDDSGVTGHRNAWVIEAGDYPVFVGQDVATARECGRVRITETVVVTQLEECLAVDPAHAFDRTVARYVNGKVVPGCEPVPTATVDLRRRILDRLPAASMSPMSPSGDFGEVLSGIYPLDDFVAGLSVEQLTALTFGGRTMNNPLGPAGNAGIMGGVTDSLRAVAVPVIVTADGPSGIRLSDYASLIPCGTALASSWDVEAVEELYRALGAECHAKGIDVLLAPGMNIHRSVLCGRNFEYYSEDPLISGMIASAVVRGLQSQGISACPKHFAANNQEFHRNRLDVRVSQRALREIYLRGFQIVVREGEPWSIMTSYNKINGVWSHYNYDLCTTILRGEWGFRGVVMTDWWMQMSPSPEFHGVRDSGYRVRAQVDVLMPGGLNPQSGELDDGIYASLEADDGLTLGELQRSARNVLSQLIARQADQGRKLHGGEFDDIGSVPSTDQ